MRINDVISVTPVVILLYLLLIIFFLYMYKPITIEGYLP